MVVDSPMRKPLENHTKTHALNTKSKGDLKAQAMRKYTYMGLPAILIRAMTTAMTLKPSG